MALEEFKLTVAQGKAMGVLASDADHVALGGGSRCLSGDTIIDGTGKTIKELAEIGQPVEVMTSHGRQMAEAPFKKGAAPLLEVVFESGKRVKVTTDHRFWDGGQWVKAINVSPGDSLAVLSSERALRPTSSGSSLSESREGDQHWMQRLEGWLGRCSLCRRRYGRQLHPSSAFSQACRAWLSGAQVRIQSSLSRLSRAWLSLGSGSHKGRPSLPSEECTRSGLLSRLRAMQDGFRGVAHASPSLCRGAVQTYAQSQRSHQGGLQSVLRSGPASSSQSGHRIVRVESHQYGDLVEIESCYDTPVSTGYVLEKVSAVTAAAIEDYYTLHVPVTEQYFANGILHHNSGKTFLLLRAVLIRAVACPDSRHAVFRFRFNAVKQSIVLETLPKVLKLCFPQLPPLSSMLDKQDWYLRLPNGSELWFCGLDDKERAEKVLGKEFATLYFNECSQIPWQSVVLALSRLAQKTEKLRLKAYYDFNPPSKKHWTYLRFIDKKDPETKRPVKDPQNYGFYLINPGDNRENLDPKYLAFLDAMPEKARNRFLLGRFADDSDGALWTEELLATNRRLGQAGEELPEWLRIIVAIDPSGCSGPEDERSDEVGIIVAALGTDNHGYLLEDLSGRYSPEQWGQIAVEAFRRHRADRIVGEKNFGGDMVRAIIHAQDGNVPYKEVNASRGKTVRAEPIAALYEQGKIHHVGFFPEVEDQQCSMTQAGYQGLKSPDRADAVVWAFTELFPMMTAKAKDEWRPPKKITQKRGGSRFDGRAR